MFFIMGWKKSGQFFCLIKEELRCAIAVDGGRAKD